MRQYDTAFSFIFFYVGNHMGYHGHETNHPMIRRVPNHFCQGQSYTNVKINVLTEVFPCAWIANRQAYNESFRGNVLIQVLYYIITFIRYTIDTKQKRPTQLNEST